MKQAWLWPLCNGVIPLAITGLGLLPLPWLAHTTLLLLYLMAVVLSALLTDWRGVLTSAGLGLLLFNYAFTQPVFSLEMHEPEEIVAAALYVVFALMTGGLAYRLRHQVDQLSFQQRFVSAQLALTKHLQDDPARADADHLATFSQQVFGDARALTLNEGQTDPLTGARGLNSDPELTHNLPEGWQSMVRALGEQWLAYQERREARQERKAAERRADEESLRNALLSSVSHDLKTPLVTMMGAATSLRDLQADLNEDDRRELLNSIILESERLEQYIQNLLDMTRLGQGELTLNRQWISIDELYHVVYRRLAAARPSPGVSFHPSGELPSVWVHAALVEQALFNALDNALKAVGSDGRVEVHAGADASTVWMDVLDQGPGLPREQWEAVFGQFYSFSRGDRYSTGSGLGLTICRGMMRVHGGEAAFVEPPDGFTLCLRLTLPVAPPGADAATRPDQE